jgi:hypothetical protein
VPKPVKISKTKLFGAQAISLIEVVFAITLVSVLFVSLYAGIASGFGLVSLARENLRANQILVEKMETLRLYSWDQINSNGFIPPTFTAQFFPSSITNVVTLDDGTTTNVTLLGSGGVTYFGTVTVTNANVSSAYATNMRMVNVTLNWTNAGIRRSRELSTLVAQNGIQNYVYY